MENIFFNGLNKLDSFEIATIERITTEYYSKFDRSIKNVALRVAIKKCDIEGKRAKYALTARIENPQIRPIVSARASDWDLARVSHKLMNKLLSESEHRLKIKGHLPKRN